jgi:hypothetical protein
VVTPILVFAAALAQAPAPAPGPGPEDAARLERIRRAIDHQPAITAVAGADEFGRPVFRMSVRAPQPEKPVWDTWTNVPSYIRPNMPGYHYKYFQIVTPEAFRAGTFLSLKVHVGAMLEDFFESRRAAHRKQEEARAREEVAQALKDLLACREDPSSPGC